MSRRIVPVGLAAVLIAGCGSGVSGTYNGGDDSFLKSMTFKGDGKVDVVLINGVGVSTSTTPDAKEKLERRGVAREAARALLDSMSISAGDRAGDSGGMSRREGPQTSGLNAASSRSQSLSRPLESRVRVRRHTRTRTS